MNNNNGQIANYNNNGQIATNNNNGQIANNNNNGQIAGQLLEESVCARRSQPAFAESQELLTAAVRNKRMKMEDCKSLMVFH